MPVLADLSSKLFDRLSRALDQEMLDELEVRRIEKEAANLMKAKPEMAHQVLGGLAALRLDVDALRSHHEASLGKAKPAGALRNYSVSLAVVGLFPEASQIADAAAERQPENLSYLRAACEYSLWAGHAKKASRLCETLHVRSPSEPRQFCDSLKQLLALFDKHGIEEKEFEESLAIAFQMLRDRGIRYHNCNARIDTKDDCAFFDISIDRAVKQVQLLDTELGHVLADKLPEMNSALVVEIVPKKEAPRVHDGQAARPA